MQAYLRKGYTCDEDVDANETPEPCTWNGIEYSSVTIAAKALGINRTTLASRLKRGRTSDRELTIRKKSCVWNGVEYPSVRYAAIELGIEPSTLASRLKHGYTCDDDVRKWERKT